MELTEDMLGRIAGSIADLRLRFSLLREALIQMGAKSEELDQVMDQALRGPDFQQARALVLEALRDGH